MKKVLLFVVLSVMLFSCSNTETKVTKITNDMENPQTWGASSIVKDVAHSGIYSCKLDSANVYSSGLQSAFEKIVKSTPQKINVTTWVYALTPNPDASIVLEISNNGKSKFWKNSGLIGVTKEKEWTEVNASFELPSDLDLKDEVKIFVWNPNKRNLYIDDLNISFK